MYKNGSSYAEMNDITSIYKDISVEAMEKEVLDKLKIAKLCFFTIKCPTCNHIHRGSQVFCPTCLDSEVFTRRLSGCRSKHCYANVQSFPDEELKKENIPDYRNKICVHKNTTGKAVYSLTPVMHIVHLYNAELDKKIINASEEDICHYIEECSKNDSISAMMCHNLIYCFDAMGKKAIVEKLINVFKGMKSTEENTAYFKIFVENLCKENSIEKRFYLNSLCLLLSLIIRNESY